MHVMQVQAESAPDTIPQAPEGLLNFAQNLQAKIATCTTSGATTRRRAYTNLRARIHTLTAYLVPICGGVPE